MHIGPKTHFAQELHARKYRGKGESFEEYAARVAGSLNDSDAHFHELKNVLQEQRFLPGGRIQAAVGSPKRVTAYNCYVAPTIEDSMEGIMEVASYAATTMRLGGGIGYDFSSIRPRGSHIVSLDSAASGPVSFMGIFDAVCKTVSSAGNRRGAQMAVLRIDHPDIEEFVEAKNNTHNLTAFNMSIGVTDKFMQAVEKGLPFDLVFDGRVMGVVDARKLWDKVMRSTWDWAEPGILFLDRINEQNNLNYCEEIAATNPCAEQPLPPNGACLLGSFNLTKYIDSYSDKNDMNVHRFINLFRLKDDIHTVVRAMDNVIDNTIYPLEAQKTEALNKRRMGLGITGLANALESMGLPYGSQKFIEQQANIMRILANEAYEASAFLAKEKGAFPLYNEKYLNSPFILSLNPNVQELIKKYGTRNSHVLSVAPTGTISLCADNVSSGIEPVYSLAYNRTVITDDGPQIEEVTDYAMREWGIQGKTALECSIQDHLNVLLTAQKYVDSAVSKTINIGEDVSWEDFKDVYMIAWKGGAKGCTTFRADGKRYGILNASVPKEKASDEACYIDINSGQKECA